MFISIGWTDGDLGAVTSCSEEWVCVADHLHFAVYRPTTWGKTQSLPFKFEAARGIITNPRSGERYTAK